MSYGTAGSVSLESAMRTCKVDQGWASRMNSDRFLNPNLMVCPVWNGRDNAGRQVCADSFYTKRAGCNSAADRVVVENALRPQYSEYVNIDAQGIRGNFYGSPHYDAGMREKTLENTHQITGQFGQETHFGQNIIPSCSVWPYQHAMAHNSQHNRMQQQLQEGYVANHYRNQSGF